MPEVGDESAQLVILSPPFINDSQEERLSKSQYLRFLETVLSEVYRILSTNGTLVTVNTDLRDHARYNNGLSRYEGSIWFKHSDICLEAERVGFKCVDCKIWVKSFNVNVYRYAYAYIMFFCKLGRKPFRPGSIKGDRRFRADVWLLEDGTHRRDSRGFQFRDAMHPMIVQRCINEFTKKGDLVVSPFTGSGTILAVAEMMGRQWIGYEVNKCLQLLIKESIYGPNRPKIYDKISVV